MQALCCLCCFCKHFGTFHGIRLLSYGRECYFYFSLLLSAMLQRSAETMQWVKVGGWQRAELLE